MDVDDFEGYLGRWSRAHGGYDVRSSRPTRAWLRVAHFVAAPFARRRVSPMWVTGAGGVAAIAVAVVASFGGRWPLLAAALVITVAVLDGVDGALAEMTDSATAWGRIVDQLVDRVSDMGMLVGLWVLGAPGPLCAAGAVLTMLDESVRASASAEGVSEVGLVTIAERPARLLIGGIAFAVAGAVPTAVVTVVTSGAVVWTVVALVATTQLVLNVGRRLRGRPRNVAMTDDGDPSANARAETSDGGPGAR